MKKLMVEHPELHKRMKPKYFFGEKMNREAQIFQDTTPMTPLDRER